MKYFEKQPLNSKKTNLQAPVAAFPGRGKTFQLFS